MTLCQILNKMVMYHSKAIGTRGAYEKRQQAVIMFTPGNRREAAVNKVFFHYDSQQPRTDKLWPPFQQ